MYKYGVLSPLREVHATLLRTVIEGGGVLRVPPRSCYPLVDREWFEVIETTRHHLKVMIIYANMPPQLIADLINGAEIVWSKPHTYSGGY